MKVINIKQVKAAAQALAKKLKGGEIICLSGDLGSGKTTFVKELGRHLGIKKQITSPTFTLMNCFTVKLLGGKKRLYHLDLYRIKNFKEAAALGLNEFWGRSDTVTFIEWGEKIKKHLPKKTKRLYFKNAAK